MSFDFAGRKGSIALALSALIAGVAAMPATAAPILVFSQQGLSAEVSAFAANGSTTISANDIAITISGLDAAMTSVPTAYLTFSATSTDAAQIGSDDNVRQDYTGAFTITSATGGAGTNYLSGSFAGLFEGINSSATLIASTPDAGAVTFTSSVIPASDLGLDRAMSLSFSGVTPGISQVFDGTTPSFQAAVSGNFSGGDTSAVPETETWAMFVLGFGLVGSAARSRKARVKFI